VTSSTSGRQLDVQTARVVQGFVSLGEYQQSVVIEWVNTYINGGPRTKESVFNEASRIIRVDTGPVGRSCPCCGR